MPTEQNPYSLTKLVCVLAVLATEGAAFIVGLTWWAQHDPRVDTGMMYFFILPMITILSIGCAALQVYYYRKDRSV